MASKKQVFHVRSNVTTQDSSTGILTPKQPESLEYGELAVNYAQGAETIFLQNSADEIVSVSNKVEVGEENPSSTNIELFVDTSIDPVEVDMYTKEEINSIVTELQEEISEAEGKDEVEIGTTTPSTESTVELFVDTSDTTSYDVYSKAEVDSLFAKLIQLNPDLNWN